MQETINDDRRVAGGGKDMILAGRDHILRQLGQSGENCACAVCTLRVSPHIYRACFRFVIA